MDLGIFLLLVVVGLAMVGMTLYMLNRSWGNFPTRIELPPVEQPSSSRWADTTGDRETPSSAAELGVAAQEPPEEIDAAAPVGGGLILLEHPMLRQAAQQALDRGSPAAQYIVRDGEHLYLALDRIHDPAQRRMAAQLLESYQAGEPVDVWGMLRIFGDLLRR